MVIVQEHKDNFDSVVPLPDSMLLSVCNLKIPNQPLGLTQSLYLENEKTETESGDSGKETTLLVVQENVEQPNSPSLNSNSSSLCIQTAENDRASSSSLSSSKSSAKTQPSPSQSTSSSSSSSTTSSTKPTSPVKEPLGSIQHISTRLTPCLPNTKSPMCSTNETTLPSVQERIEQFQQISRQQQQRQQFAAQLNSPKQPTDSPKHRFPLSTSNTPQHRIANSINSVSTTNTPSQLRNNNNNNNHNPIRPISASNTPQQRIESPRLQSILNQLNNLNNNSSNRSVQSTYAAITRTPIKSALKKDKEPIARLRGLQIRNIDYTDEDDSSSEEENSLVAHATMSPVSMSSLQAKLQRIDSLSRFLKDRPRMQDLVDSNILPASTGTQRKVEREKIEITLDRKLSLRPTPSELEQRNILHTLSQEEMKKQIEDTKNMLVRKLSYRPTIQELRDKCIIRFYDYIEVSEVEDYDRRADKPWTRLTPRDKAMIRNELNLYKSTEMEVHEESRHLIRFHKP